MKRITFEVYGLNGHITETAACRIPPIPEHGGLLLVVHRSVNPKHHPSRAWVVAELTTSFAIGKGCNREAAIENAVQALAKRTPDQIKAALRFAEQTVANMQKGEAA